MKLNNRPLRRPAILCQEVSGSTVLLNPDTGQYYSLEEVGGSAWRLANGSLTVYEIASLLQDDFDAPLLEIAADLLDLFRELADEQLVHETG